MSHKVFQQALEQIRSGRLEHAERTLRAALQRAPRQPELNDMLGTVLVRLDRLEQARYHHEIALREAPDRPEFLNNYAGLFLAQRRPAEARALFERALSINPREVMAMYGLARALAELREYSALERVALQARTLSPEACEPWLNLAIAHLQSGRQVEGIQCLVQAVQRNPVVAGPMYLSSLLYHPAIPPAQVLAEHAEFGRLLARTAVPNAGKPAASHSPVAEKPVAAGERKLRIGYLSSDLRRHSVAIFMERLLASHDRTRCFVGVYHTSNDDEVSARLRPHADRWVGCASMSDADLARTIAGDALDVLIELNGHTVGGRPGVIARRPAPRIVSYLGYACSAGLPGITGRIVDHITDPPGSEHLALEPPLRLDRVFLCFTPPEQAPDVAQLPALSNGFVTFGAFNAAPKINDRVIDAWAGVLHRTPRSRLLVKCAAMADEGVRARFTAQFTRAGIDLARIELIGWADSLVSHLNVYNRVDIALDCFPYNGTTTTCEALWMGVPTVTVRGTWHVSRVGESILSAVGLHHLVAADPPSMADVSSGLAADLPALAAMRTCLRKRTIASPLCDGVGLAKALESSLRAHVQAQP